MSALRTSPAALIKRGKTGSDGYGNDVYGETVTVVPGVFAPGGSVEATSGQDQVVSTPTVYLPAGTDVSAVDAVIPQVVTDSFGEPVLDGDGRPQGTRYEVDGLPQTWPANPFTGWQPPLPVVARLKETTG